MNVISFSAFVSCVVLAYVAYLPVFVGTWISSQVSFWRVLFVSIVSRR